MTKDPKEELQNQEPDVKNADVLKEVKNWQSKYEESLELIKQVNAQNEALLSTINQPRTSPTPQQTQDPKDWYEVTPEQYKNKLKEELRQELLNEVSTTQASQQQITAFANEAFSKYPDLNKKSSELRKAADKYYDALPKNLKGTPEGYELAVTRAVNATGAKAVSKRIIEDDDDFSFSSGSNDAPSNKSKKSGELNDADFEFSRKMGYHGLNLNDPKIAERVQKKKAEYAKLGKGR